jgi:class 3 adenylate cyclase
VGKLVVGSRRPLSTYERDVFDLFSDVLQKRIVDFSKVGKLLHRTFPTPVVLRLLDEPDPMARLAPRAADVSILFADVVSFTRLSEQVMQDPVAVGAFIEAWSRGATQILWKHGGVLDKLIGDCVIGLFGPPYYEQSAEERALACVRAAAEIVRFTRGMLDHPAAAAIKAADETLGVAVGLNECPASVGLFGLNADFTAFAPGMNNAARLQAQAGLDEVLVMEPMKELLEAAGAPLRFGPRREAAVKNVADPLAFHALEVDSVEA